MEGNSWDRHGEEGPSKLLRCAMPLTTLTHLDDYRCFRLEGKAEQWLENTLPATLRSFDFIL